MPTQTDKHTPTPWILANNLNRDIRAIQQGNVYCSAGGSPLAKCDDPANAAFIVRACNAHEALVAALEAVSKWSDGTNEWEKQTQAALHLATAHTPGAR